MLSHCSQSGSYQHGSELHYVTTCGIICGHIAKEPHGNCIHASNQQFVIFVCIHSYYLKVAFCLIFLVHADFVANYKPSIANTMYEAS